MYQFFFSKQAKTCMNLCKEDFDDNLINHFVGDFKKTTKMLKKQKSLRKGRTVFDRTKRTFCAFAAHSNLNIDSLVKGIDF